jgi:LAO/AO transport system kinase
MGLRGSTDMVLYFKHDLYKKEFSKEALYCYVSQLQMTKKNNRYPVKTYLDGILRSDRLLLSRAITLAESSLPADQELAQELLTQVLPHTGRAIRIGITGVPGVGKSTFIEVFGKIITSLGKKLAVLAVDPSSQRTRGSIMGDKTRMETLSIDPLAYIRPSPAGDSLGGVTRSTRQALLLCEAAGYEVLIIETVGVGQSETAVHGMVDFFLLLALAGAGDELQGIKRGIMEMADAIAITKADGQNKQAAEQAAAMYKNALHLFPLSEKKWNPPVVTCSAYKQEGIRQIWEIVNAYHQQMQANGYHIKNRQKQSLQWMYETIKQGLESSFYTNPQIQAQLPVIEQKVINGKLPALTAALRLLSQFNPS